MLETFWLRKFSLALLNVIDPEYNNNNIDQSLLSINLISSSLDGGSSFDYRIGSAHSSPDFRSGVDCVNNPACNIKGQFNNANSSPNFNDPPATSDSPIAESGASVSSGTTDFPTPDSVHNLVQTDIHLKPGTRTSSLTTRLSPSLWRPNILKSSAPQHCVRDPINWRDTEFNNSALIENFQKRFVPISLSREIVYRNCYTTRPNMFPWSEPIKDYAKYFKQVFSKVLINYY